MILNTEYKFVTRICSPAIRIDFTQSCSSIHSKNYYTSFDLIHSLLAVRNRAGSSSLLGAETKFLHGEILSPFCLSPATVPSSYPQSFLAVASSSRSAIITWEPPRLTDQNGIIVLYTINVTVADSGELFQLTSTTTSLTVTTLRPFTSYFCIIAASTSVGIGPFSTVITLQTPEDGMSLVDARYNIIMLITACPSVYAFIPWS